MKIELYNANCINAMADIPEHSVDLILTDPPYNLGQFMKSRDTNLVKMRKNFFGNAGWDDLPSDEWSQSMDHFFASAARVVRPGGAMVVFMAIIKVETIIRLAQKNGFYYKTTGVWHKVNPMPRNMNLHFVNSTEAWIYFTYKKRTGTFNNGGNVIHDFYQSAATPASEKRYGKHPTQKPEQLMAHFVNLLTNAGDTILDPFMGSGSTGVAAIKNKRNFIGIELDKTYFDIAQKRTDEACYQTKPTVLDLFAGVGGLSLGFEKAGFKIISALEYDKQIAESYKKNHKDVPILISDITKIDIKQIYGPLKGKVDIIIGGPPCQGFSQKGKRRSLNDPRNFLFKAYYEVVKLIEPKYFLMENVPNLLTTENGYFKKEIEELFGSLGYKVSAGVLCAADYGVPQDRSRAIIMGRKGNKALPMPARAGARVTIWDAIGDLAFLKSGEGSFCQTYQLPPQSDYQRELRGDSPMLYNHQATAHSKVAMDRMKMIPANCTEKVLPESERTKSVYSGTWTRMNQNGISVTITTRFDTPSSGQFTHPYLDRAITVREAARIQSFPDDFIFYGTKSSQMKQVGNAVPPRLAQAIAEVFLTDMNT